jgi:hypothetical protein
MTDKPKRTRQPRELSYSAAVAKLRKWDADYSAAIGEEEADRSRRMLVVRDRFGKKREAILANVPAPIRAAVIAEAEGGAHEGTEFPDDVEEEAMMAPPDLNGSGRVDIHAQPRVEKSDEPWDPGGVIDEPELPPGAREYVPGPAARAARGRT